MSWPWLLMTAVALGADCMTVSLALSASGKTGRAATRYSLMATFGLFQGGMTLVGSFVGRLALNWIEQWAGWVALALLAGVGGHMIYESFQPESEEEEVASRFNPGHPMSLLALGVATSLDALGVGFGLNVAGAGIWISASVIALVSFLMSGVGLILGRRVEGSMGEWMGRLGGLLLIGIGVKIWLS